MPSGRIFRLFQVNQEGEPQTRATSTSTVAMLEPKLTAYEWKKHRSPDEPIGSMLTVKGHVLSDSVFCTGPGALDPTSASKQVVRTKQNIS